MQVAAWHAAKVATIGLFRSVGMFYPRLADLLEAIVIGRSTAHSVEILGDDGMTRTWHRKKIHQGVSGIAGCYSHCQAALRPGRPVDS
jgi:hypothetical protein